MKSFTKSTRDIWCLWWRKQYKNTVIHLEFRLWSLIFREKKEWTELFEVSSIADANITVDKENSLVIFWNTHIKSYICLQKDIIINNLKKTVDEKISTLFDYPKIEKCRRQRQL